MIYCCPLRLWSKICVTCQSCWFPDSVVLSCCAGARCLRPEGWLHTYEMVTEHFASPNLSGCCEMLAFRVCGVRQNLYVFSLYCNPNLDDRIFDCLLASMAAVQAEDVRASFLSWPSSWPSSGVVGFYDHEPSWSCSLCLRNCLRLRSVGCRPNSCTWWNT